MITKRINQILMKRTRQAVGMTLLILTTLPLGGVQAQQDPIFTYYLQNPIAFNPAVAGTASGLNLSLLTRHQWVGLEGAPTSYSFGAHSPYVKDLMGLGFHFMTDQVGQQRNTHVTGSYAYQIQVVEGMRLSMGLRAGVSNYRAATGTMRVNDPTDPHFLSDLNRTAPNLGVGFFLFTANYYIGFSTPRLFEPRLNREYRNSSEPYNPQLFLKGGYDFLLNREWRLKPSLLVGAMGGSPVLVNITAQAQYMERIIFGTHYRIGDALGVFVNGMVNENLGIGYAYSFSLSRLSTVNGSIHEFVIIYSLKNIWQF